MNRIWKGMTIQMLAAVCVLMQVVVTLPHHHHAGGDVSRVNIFHCGNGCTKQAGDGHKRTSDEKGDRHVCLSSHFDMVTPERKDIAGPAEFVALPTVAQTIHICPVHDLDAALCRNTIRQLDRKRLRVEVPLPWSFIAAAIPPRAPSFTV